jgi:adenosine deaminase
VTYAEVFFDPQAHTSRVHFFETVINGYYRATQESEQIGVRSALIMCFLRDFSAESAEETFEQALPFKDKILGIGLDSDEKGNPPLKFKKVFEKAKAAGFHLTMHCDIDQEDSIEHIRQVIEDIQGGTNRSWNQHIVEDEQLVEYMYGNIKSGLTCCPVSNGFVVDDMKGKRNHRPYWHKGIKVTINSDDPAYFQSYISDDLYALSQNYQLTEEHKSFNW